MSEAEESHETSGTKGSGVRHYRREPRHEVAPEHQRPCNVRDIRQLKEVTNQTEHTVQWQLLDRSRGHSVSQDLWLSPRIVGWSVAPRIEQLWSYQPEELCKG